MNKLNLAKIVKDTKNAVSKHSPEILTAVGVVGMFTSTVLAVKATPKAVMLMADKKLELSHEYGEDVDTLTPAETIKTTWKCYVPAAFTGLVSAACIIGAQSVNAKRNTAIMAAYKLAESALTDYKETVIETIGEEKERDIRSRIAQKHVDRNPVRNNQVIIMGNAEYLYYEPISSRYLKTTANALKEAEIELNRRMLHDISGYASVNDLYDELELENTDVGDELGWNTSYLIKIDIHETKIAPDGSPCFVIDYGNPPRYNYTRFM
jgi:hypothetical protein